jgi:aminopeptidase-like protein
VTAIIPILSLINQLEPVGEIVQLEDLIPELDLPQLGDSMHALITELFPICRSITGDGMRTTLRAITANIPMTIHEVPSGTEVFDWTVPNEWNIRDAYIKNAAGERVVDFQQHNLHIVNYSTPIQRRMTLAELRPHLYSDPQHPEHIPYRTSYYKETWGFCLSHQQLEQLPDGEYEVLIDSTLAPGSLSYGECVLPGASSNEVLISAHACHPSLANDNLSGVVVATMLAQLLHKIERRYTYRFVFIPGTIGSITWLARNEAITSQIKHGLVLTCVGDPAPITYKQSRQTNAAIDRTMQYVLAQRAAPHTTLAFYPYGYDERQYCSPGFNLPVGVLMRSQHGTFAEYHSSADNLNFVQPAALADTLAVLLNVVQVLEGDRCYLNEKPKCEPRLGKRGLYGSLGGAHGAGFEQALLWVLSLSDGQHSLLAIAERSGLPFATIKRAADALATTDLLTVID